MFTVSLLQIFEKPDKTKMHVWFAIFFPHPLQHAGLTDLSHLGCIVGILLYFGESVFV